MTDIRTTRARAEALVQTDPDIRVTRMRAEALVQTDPIIRVTRMRVEVLRRVDTDGPDPQIPLVIQPGL